MVAGNISNKGLILIACASDAKTGKMTWVVAVFDVISVKNVTSNETDEIINTGGTVFKPTSCVPTH